MHRFVAPHPRDVPADQARDCVLVEEATPTHPFAREDLAQEGSERTTEPVGKGNAEPLLPAPEDGGGKAVGERALEETLQASEAGQLEPRRDATQELDEGVVEERSPQLESCRHARAVGVHQVLAGEILLAVLVDQTGRGVLSAAGCEGRSDVRVRIEAMPTGTDLARKQPRYEEAGGEDGHG